MAFGAAASPDAAPAAAEADKEEDEADEEDGAVFPAARFLALGAGGALVTADAAAATAALSELAEETVDAGRPPGSAPVATGVAASAVVRTAGAARVTVCDPEAFVRVALPALAPTPPGARGAMVWRAVHNAQAQ